MLRAPKAECPVHYNQDIRAAYLDAERCMKDFQVVSIPEIKEESHEIDWFYEKFDVVVRVICTDGTFLVVVRKKI